jgi:hypothetical protein
MASGKMIERGERLHEAMQKIKEGMSSACFGYLQAGQYLNVIKKEKLWRDYSPAISFGQWVQGEIGISKSTAYHMIAVYEKFGQLVLGNPEYHGIEYSHLVALLPYTKSAKSARDLENLLLMINGQTMGGIKNNLRALSGKVASDEDCLHEELKTVQVCERCGKWFR